MSLSHLTQSEAAESLAHSDSLPWLQIEAKVFGGFKQQNDGGAQVKLSYRLPFMQDHAPFIQRRHTPLTCHLQHLVNIAAVEKSPFTVVRSVGVKLLVNQ